jgi:sec-independent protein translocase protein TatC
MSRIAPPEPPPETPPEQEPGEKYLTLAEHIGELRTRLIFASLGVVFGLAITAIFGNEVIDFLKQPAEARAEDFQLQFIEPFEMFVTYFRVALLGGLVIGMPVIVYQGLRFISPGLRPSERRWLFGTVIGATVLFASGVAFAYYVALPPAMGFLLNFGDDLADPNIRIGSYIDFVTRLLFWTGVAFQTPIVVMYLSRFGIMTPAQMIKWWRYAIVAAFVIAAIVTPTIDPVTQSLVAGPIIVLYFLGVILAVLVRPRKD